MERESSPLVGGLKPADLLLALSAILLHGKSWKRGQGPGVGGVRVVG